jgi:RimJ/RimL family protein N-acetyltransferase
MALLSSHLPLKTNRFEIRYFFERELDWLFGLERDPLVMKYVASGPYQETRESWMERVKKRIDAGRFTSDYGLAVVQRSNDTLCGSCGIHFETINGRITGECDLRIVLQKRIAGTNGARGIEIANALIDVSFQRLGARFIVAQIDERNTPAAKLVESLGFQFAADEGNEERKHKQRFKLDRAVWSEQRSTQS